jgi:hypothetical protein
MGGTTSCQRYDDGQDHGCSFIQEYMLCVHTDEGTDYNNYGCHATPQKTGLRLILPIVLVLLAALLLRTFLRYRALRRIRETQAVYSEAVAQEHGRFAAGSSTWSVDRDLLPYLAPKRWRTWCIVEPGVVRALLSFSVVVLCLAVIFFVLGFCTTAENQRYSWWPDNDSMGSVSIFALFPLFTLLCCVPMCMRCSCFGGAQYHQRRNAAYQQLYPQAPIAQHIIVQDPNFPQHQPQQFQQPYSPQQQVPMGQVHIPIGYVVPNQQFQPLPQNGVAPSGYGQPMPYAQHQQHQYAPPPMRSPVEYAGAPYSNTQ